MAIAGFGHYAGPNPEHEVGDQLGSQGRAESGTQALIGS